MRVMKFAPALAIVLAVACTDASDEPDADSGVVDLTGQSEDRDDPFEDGFDGIGQ